VSGSTNPATTPERLVCYIVDQATDSTHGLLNLPESFTNGRTYIVQYGRRYTFAAAGQDTKHLQLKRQVYSAASLDALVSNTSVASGNLDLCLDIGNDGSCDYHPTGSQTFPATLNATGLANAFNTYLLGRTDIAWGSSVDVPVRVQVDRQADVMLTNLALTPVGAKTRFLRLPAGTYDNVALGIQFGTAGTPAGPLAFTVDVGADGTVDTSYSGTPAAYPAVIATGGAAVTKAFNDYLAPRTGDVDVPIRITPSPSLDTVLASFSATPSARPDASIVAGDVTFSNSAPTETDEITVNAALHNGGTLGTGPLTASFFATPAGGTPWYIGSKFVDNILATGTITAHLVWNTTGFTGTVPVRVTIDPFNRVAESSETNNQATASVTIKTRPDLQFTDFQLSDPEPVAGETVTVTLPLRNNGQTTAGEGTVTLYDGNPDAGGTLVETLHATSLPGGMTTTVAFPWTPATPGPHRLFAHVDRDRQVSESNEGNNDQWRDVYIGFGQPIILDSGTPAADPAYIAALGYGAVDTGLADAVVTCAGHDDPTLRRDPSNRIGYRFDHLQPGRFYHLDLVLYECDNAGRVQQVLVDGLAVAGPVDLGDQSEHRLSIRLDPAVYRDHAIDVAIIGQEGSQRAAVVASIALREIDYRYADSGGANDPNYTAARGWGYLDTNSVAISGALPYQSARVDQDDNELRYRFDRLDPARRYFLHLTFWQATGNPLLQRVRADGLDTGATVNLVAGSPVSITIRLSPATYASDHSAVVGVAVLNANANATINEISLEEETLLTEPPCHVTETPSDSIAFGYLAINGTPAPVGTVVTAENPRGDIVGCYVVGTDGSPAGQYGFMPIYGEDASATPPIPGMRDGELVTFRVDGALAKATPPFYWHNDHTPHQVDLVVVPLLAQAILLQPNWNLISFRLEPPVPLVEPVLSSITGKYCRILGEEGPYECTLPPQFRTLKELHAGQGYYLRLDGGTSANLLIEGVPLPPTSTIALHDGWNWVGYLPTSTLPVTTALASIAGAYQRVLSLNQYYDTRYPASFSTLKQMTPGQGYLIYATQPATLTYPTAPTFSMAGEPSPPVTTGEVCQVTPTPALTLLFGQLTVAGQPAATGTRVEAVTPAGEVAGCTVVTTAGQYGFMAVYGEDATASPPIPGFRDGEPIRLRVNGALIPASVIPWQDDLTPHLVDVAVAGSQVYLPMMLK